MATRLSVAAVAKLKPGPKCREVLDAGGAPGLFLVIQPSGHKSWIVRWKHAGRRYKYTLGTVDTSGKELQGEPEVGAHLTLAAARRLASEVARQRAMGRDPIAERKAAKMAVRIEKSTTGFAAAAGDYVEQHCRAKKKSRTWWKIGLVLGLDYHRDEECFSPTIIKNSLAARWRDRPVSEITDADVFAVADEAAVTAIPGRRAKNNGRSNAREREMINALSGMFKWLRKRRLVAALPTSGLEREASGKRDRVLTVDELRRLWLAIPDSPLGRVVKVMIYTGQRVGEVSGMRRSELSDGVWTIPEERSKNKLRHVVPLSPATQELIQGDGDLVFTTNGRTQVSGFSKLKARLDRELKFTKPWRLHDIRRTVATMMGEMGIEPHIVEEVLGHVSYKAGVGGLYNRATYEARKRAAIERWADHVEAIVSGEKADNVTQLAWRDQRQTI